MTKSRIEGHVIAAVMIGTLGACGGEDGGSEQDSGADVGVACASRATALIAAPATQCHAYQLAADGQCGGYYCELTEATLTPLIPAGGACAGDPAFTCEGRLVNLVGNCARQVKTANISMTNCEVRPLIQDCVYADAEMKEKVKPSCLSCFLDAAECAGDNCLIECLVGDSPQCDACNLAHNCQQPVFTCAGLPSPFAY